MHLAVQVRIPVTQATVRENARSPGPARMVVSWARGTGDVARTDGNGKRNERVYLGQCWHRGHVVTLRRYAIAARGPTVNIRVQDLPHAGGHVHASWIPQPRPAGRDGLPGLRVGGLRAGSDAHPGRRAAGSCVGRRVGGPPGPATARAGDIYVVLDTPGSSVGFAQRKRTAAEAPGPLTDEDLDRLARGDTQGTASEGSMAPGARRSNGPRPAAGWVPAGMSSRSF